MVQVLCLAIQALFDRPEHVAKKRQQASKRRAEDEADITTSTTTHAIVATITHVLHLWLDREFALAMADIDQIISIPATCPTRVCLAMHCYTLQDLGAKRLEA